MQRHQEIIEEYRHSDFEHRLSLFLSYPSHRRSFVEIDQGENERKKAVQQTSSKFKLGRGWKKGWIREWLKV